MNLERLAPAMRATVSVLICGAFFSCIGALFAMSYYKLSLEPGVKEVLLILVGVLAGSFKDVTGYWLGSSASSARKTELAAKLTE